jgi:hypothetical protein
VIDQSKWLIARRRRRRRRRRKKKREKELNLGTRSKICLHDPSSKCHV